MIFENLLWQLKLLSTISVFAMKIKLLKNNQKCFLSYQKSSFSPQDFQFFVLSSSSLFSFLGYCWFSKRSSLMIDSKVYDIIIPLNWVLKCQFWWSKVRIWMLHQLVEYYIAIISVEKSSCPKAKFSLLHWQEDSPALLMLISALHLVWSNTHPEPWIEVAPHDLAKHIIRVWISYLCFRSWSNCLVVKVLDFRMRGLGFKTTGWLQGQFSVSSSNVDEVSIRHS